MSLLLAVQGGGPTNYALTGLAGSYSLAGGSATLTKATAHSLIALAGSYSVTGGSALMTLTGTAPAGREVEFYNRRSYIKRGKKIHLFNSADEADAWLEAERLAQEALDKAQKTSRRARKRLRERVYRIAAIEPVTLEIPAIQSMVSRFDMDVDLPALIAQEAWDRVMQIQAMAMAMQDEDDCELLLLLG